MPNVWEASREVDRPSLRGVRVGAGDWAWAAQARHEIRRRELVAGNDARRETRSTQGDAMTERRPDDDGDGGAVVWIGLMALALLLGAVVAVAVLVARVGGQ